MNTPASRGVGPGATPEPPLEVQQLPLKSIGVTGDNPRRELVADELMESIRTHGLLQPIVVRRAGRRYELIAGHRRLEAMRQLGWTHAPAVVRTDRGEEAPVLRLVENLQRRDLRPVEEAAALEALIRTRGWSTHQVAAAIGRSQAYVSKRLRVFEDPLLAPAVLADQLSISAAEELLTLDEKTRYDLLTQAIENRWDRQQVRRAAAGEFAANLSRPLTNRLRELRVELHAVGHDAISSIERREMRLLVAELMALLGAETPAQSKIVPAEPGRARPTGRTRTAQN